MKKHLPIGIAGGEQIAIKLDTFIGQRALIQGASGSGKSYLLRKITELVCPHVPVIVIDPEGEFPSLREKRDVVIVGAHGDLRPDPATADVLARKLLELRVSAVVDISDLQLFDRRAFVSNFCKSLMDAPRNLWQPLFVAIDEAHVFAPEQDRDAMSREPIGCLASQGRKRAFGCLLATQRISKLHKDVVAECNNVFVGKTFLDLDLKRACDVLGIPAGDRAKVRDLTPGEWFCFGPSLATKGVAQMKCHRTETSHPRPGSVSRLSAPAPSDAIKKFISELSSAARGEDPLTLDEAKGVIARLRHEIRHGAGAARDPTSADVKLLVALDAERARGHLMAKAIHVAMPALVSLGESIAHQHSVATEQIKKTVEDVNKVLGRCARDQEARPPAATLPAMPRAPSASSPRTAVQDGAMPKLGKAVRKILTVLAQEGRSSKAKVAIVSGYAVGGGGFNNAVSEARTNGWITGSDPIEATRAGLDVLGPVTPLPVGRDLAMYWINSSDLGKAEKSILTAMLNHGTDMDKESLATASGYEAGGGGFNNAISRLRTRGLISGSKTLSLSPHLVG